MSLTSPGEFFMYFCGVSLKKKRPDSKLIMFVFICSNRNSKNDDNLSFEPSCEFDSSYFMVSLYILSIFL